MECHRVALILSARKARCQSELLPADPQWSCLPTAPMAPGMVRVGFDYLSQLIVQETAR